MKKILIVEDEKNISNLLKTHLEREGYRCLQAFDGISAVEMFAGENPDLIILDLMLPGKNGFEVCREIREKSDVYILMLTAKQEEIDKLLGLEMGADDYMIKPFSIRELLARVKVLLRRPHLLRDGEENDEALTIGDLAITPSHMEVRLKNKKISLTTLEFEVLYFLARNAGIVLQREVLLSKLWGQDSEVFDRSIDRIISRLRKKIEDDPAQPQRILTIRGVGYKFDENS